MKYRKTPKRERSTYIYRFDNGDKATVSIGKMTLIIHDGRTFTYPDESITQESIGMLHRLDDKEVRELGKMVNMESPQEKKRRLALKRKWDIEHPGKDDNHYAKASKNIRLDAFLESERWDEIDNLLYLQSDQNNEKRALESKAKIRQFVDTFFKEEKILYKEYYVKEMSYKEIAEIIGIPVDAACCRLKRLNRKIRVNFKGISDPKRKKSRTRLVKGHESQKGEQSSGKQNSHGGDDHRHG